MGESRREKDTGRERELVKKYIHTHIYARVLSLSARGQNQYTFFTRDIIARSRARARYPRPRLLFYIYVYPTRPSRVLLLSYAREGEKKNHPPSFLSLSLSLSLSLGLSGERSFEDHAHLCACVHTAHRVAGDVCACPDFGDRRARMREKETTVLCVVYGADKSLPEFRAPVVIHTRTRTHASFNNICTCASLYVSISVCVLCVSVF